MTKEEAITRLKVLTDYEYNEDLEALEIAIKALEQKPYEDAVSRQAAIDAFEKFIHELGIKDEPYNYGEMALSIQNVPSVISQPKTGYWQDTGSGQECSECGEIQYGYDSFRNYCANCGARMVETQESEEVE